MLSRLEWKNPSIHISAYRVFPDRGRLFVDSLQRADIAAAPMYTTGQRSQDVDFTEPFMDVYATILMRRRRQDSIDPEGPAAVKSFTVNCTTEI